MFGEYILICYRYRMKFPFSILIYTCPIWTLIAWDRILVQITIYRKLRIGQEDHKSGGQKKIEINSLSPQKSEKKVC